MQNTTKQLIKLIKQLKSDKNSSSKQSPTPSILADTLVKEVSGGKTGVIEVFGRWTRN